MHCATGGAGSIPPAQAACCEGLWAENLYAPWGALRGGVKLTISQYLGESASAHSKRQLEFFNILQRQRGTSPSLQVDQ
eukprot:3183712-Rhodomonas_salina.1